MQSLTSSNSSCWHKRSSSHGKPSKTAFNYCKLLTFHPSLYPSEKSFWLLVLTANSTRSMAYTTTISALVHSTLNPRAIVFKAIMQCPTNFALHCRSRRWDPCIYNLSHSTRRT